MRTPIQNLCAPRPGLAGSPILGGGRLALVAWLRSSVSRPRSMWVEPSRFSLPRYMVGSASSSRLAVADVFLCAAIRFASLRALRRSPALEVLEPLSFTACGYLDGGPLVSDLAEGFEDAATESYISLRPRLR